MIMRARLTASLLLGLLILVFSFALAKPAADPGFSGETRRVKSDASAEASQQNETPAPSPERAAYADSAVTVRVLDGGEVRSMALDEYLMGVVAAEMPADFETAALRAQAAAARTYTLYKMTVSPSENHPEADVCTDHRCCKAYLSDAQLRERWGGAYSDCMERISDAVRGTDGVCIYYAGEPILAAFHSSSPGLTASSREVWGGDLPYLVSVESPEGEDSVPDYVSSVTVSRGDFRETVLAAYPEADFSGELIGDMTYSGSGRLLTASVGGVELTGRTIRALFGLRSTAAEVEVTDDDVIFTTVGYGHGVGMSQYGANEMAKTGSTYEEILAHYYTGTTLGPIPDLSL